VSDKFDRLANEFKPDALGIEESRVPFATHAALYVALGLIVIGVIWAFVGRVDRIVIGEGKVATRTPMMVMQPFTTSRIVSIDVQAGDHVTKGQVLARFDPAFAQADVAALQQKVVSLTAQAERLEAQLAGKPFIAGANADPERLAQAQIYAQEAGDFNAQLNQRASRMGQIESELRSNQAAIPGIQQQLGVANQVMSMQQRLQREQAAATLDVLRAQSSQIDSTMKLRNTQGEVQRLTNQRAESQHERQAFLDKWRSERTQQLVETRRQIAEASETLTKATRMREFTEITAPVNGTVLEVADRSIGSTLREAETLLTLVPDDADLYVEAMVQSRDVSYLKLGDTVRVKLESYPFQRFGTLEGSLAEISPDSISQQQGENAPARLVYRVQVRLAAKPSETLSRGIRLKPGLVATAEIKTGDRTIASYVLDPVLKIADESLREP
jgi:HlyD family secretion protein